MTVEEYDSKVELRKTIHDIDKTLREFDKYKDHPAVTFKGVGYIGYCGGCTISQGTNDPIVVERFKQLLIERKKELVEEFSK